MKLAVFSDIHSNRIALETCVKFAEHLAVDEYIFLGDHIGIGYDPHGTLEILRALSREKKTVILRGPAETALIKRGAERSVPRKNGCQYERQVFTPSELTTEDFAFLRSLPETALLTPMDSPAIYAEHLPGGQFVTIYPGTEAADILLRGAEHKVLLTGYSHIQFRYEAFGKQMINPGSVGLPSRGFRKAQFSLLTCENGRVSTRMLNLDYDIAAALRELERSNLSIGGGVYTKILARAYRTGENALDDVRRLVMQYSHLEDAAAAEERYWEMAAVELKLF
ncbi:MAG: metallophosphoesterase family protein [Christensenellales bacterium]|jgi:predicted phosphodiesterase